MTTHELLYDVMAITRMIEQEFSQSRIRDPIMLAIQIQRNRILSEAFVVGASHPPALELIAKAILETDIDQ